MSMAIKYAMQKKAKKMADGGPCDEHGTHMCKMCHGGMYADGGFVEEEEESGYMPRPEEHADHMYEHPVENQGDHEDMVGRIMKKRMMHSQHYSEGGRVANDTPPDSEFEPNQFDDLVKDDDLEEHYTGANSGDEIGNHQEDEDRRDIIARIMKSRRLKDRNPRPA
jgi:hypothetical protein